MGGIVTGLWKKTNGSAVEGASPAEETTATPMGEEKKSGEDEKDEEKKSADDETAEKEEPTLLHAVSSTKGDLVMDSETDESRNQLSDEKPTEPEKPVDLIYSLDLYPTQATILTQIREHFNELRSLSEEMRVTFLSQPPEKSFRSKKKIPVKKLILSSTLSLKELKHRWLRPFESHLSSFPVSKVICLDLHFHQLSSLKVPHLLSLFPDSPNPPQSSPLPSPW